MTFASLEISFYVLLFYIKHGFIIYIFKSYLPVFPTYIVPKDWGEPYKTSTKEQDAFKSTENITTPPPPILCHLLKHQNSNQSKMSSAIVSAIE